MRRGDVVTASDVSDMIPDITSVICRFRFVGAGRFFGRPASVIDMPVG